jgi:hypothetical protein
MNSFMAITLMAAFLGPSAMAQTQPDPATKTGDGKAAQPRKTSQSNCTGQQGGVDASGGESIEMQTKSDKAGGHNSANCGKSNGKASAPHAAPTVANPDVKKPDVK